MTSVAVVTSTLRVIIHSFLEISRLNEILRDFEI